MIQKTAGIFYRNQGSHDNIPNGEKEQYERFTDEIG